jgi:hypothetical protein
MDKHNEFNKKNQRYYRFNPYRNDKYNNNIKNRLTYSNTENDNKSPHTLQNLNSKYISTDSFTRVLSDTFPEEPYRRRRHEDKTLIHIGQRKLHMSEVEFLTECCSELYEKKKQDKKIVLIYAGAAHGVHIPTLINMFPFIEYILIDPGKFQIDHTLYPEKVTCNIENCLMTDEKADKLYEQYKDYTRLFISDIRTSDIKEKNEKEREDTIMKDMNAQMKWYYILRPFKSMLKFRLPYVGNNKNAVTKIQYLEGIPHFQLWAGCTSSETRLFVSENAGLKSYDCIKYENQLFRFNTNERTSCYKHDIELPGIDHCYDCYAETFIYNSYLENFEKINSFVREIKIIKKIVKEYMEELTINIKADKRLIKLVYRGELHYVLFKNMKYDKKAEEIFNNYTKSIQSEEARAFYRSQVNYSDSESDDNSSSNLKKKLENEDCNNHVSKSKKPKNF